MQWLKAVGSRRVELEVSKAFTLRGKTGMKEQKLASVRYRELPCMLWYRTTSI
jgi:hypothetical protein